jgi:hypothetical protein
MEIVPLFGDQIVTASSVEVRVDPEDRNRVRALVERVSAVTEVSDDVTFAGARRAAGELKAMLDEIEISRKAAKQPFDAVGTKIGDLAKDIAGPVKAEQNRILGLLGAHVARLEAARKEQERRDAEARRLAEEEAMRKIKEAKSAREREQAQLALDLAGDVEDLGKDHEPVRGLVPGGRVDHKFDFELESIQQVCAAGLWRLVRWELDIRACQDAVKNQLDNGIEEPRLAGIRVTKRLSVSVKSAARIQ